VDTDKTFKAWVLTDGKTVSDKIYGTKADAKRGLNGPHINAQRAKAHGYKVRLANVVLVRTARDDR